jgi:hypothetical protein
MRLMRSLMRAAALLGSMLTIVGLAQLPARASAGPWVLGQDFLAHPSANPVPSHSGAAWYLLQSRTLAHNSKYVPLAAHTSSFLGLKGYSQWSGSSLSDSPSALSPRGYPFIGVNGSGQNADPPAEYSTPPGYVVVHPNGPGAGDGPAALAVIGWRSPVSSVARAVASFSPLDTVCGHTIVWSVDSGAAARL